MVIILSVVASFILMALCIYILLVFQSKPKMADFQQAKAVVEDATRRMVTAAMWGFVHKENENGKLSQDRWVPIKDAIINSTVKTIPSSARKAILRELSEEGLRELIGASIEIYVAEMKNEGVLPPPKPPEAPKTRPRSLIGTTSSRKGSV